MYSVEVQSSEGVLRRRSMAYFSVVGYTCVLVHLPRLRWLRYFRHPFCSWSPADVIFVDFDNDGVGTWHIRKEDVDSLSLKMVFANRERRHGVSIVYVSTGLQVSGYGCMKSGLLVDQATTQRWWLVMASCYASQGHIMICGCVFEWVNVCNVEWGCLHDNHDIRNSAWILLPADLPLSMSDFFLRRKISKLGYIYTSTWE